jgi:hypothetical protein
MLYGKHVSMRMIKRVPLHNQAKRGGQLSALETPCQMHADIVGLMRLSIVMEMLKSLVSEIRRLHQLLLNV